MNESDEKLMCGIAGGSHSAPGLLYDKYANAVFALSRRVLGRFRSSIR